MQVVTGGDKYETALSDFYAVLKFPIVSGHRIGYVLAMEAERYSNHYLILTRRFLRHLITVAWYLDLWSQLMGVD